MEEKELCRRTTFFGNKKYLYLAIGFTLFALTAIVVNIIIRMNSAKRYGNNALSLFEGPYWAGWGCMILGIILAAIFFYLHHKQLKGEYTIVLTNKRIKTYTVIKRNSGKDLYTEESFLLNKIVSFSKVKDDETNAMSYTFNTVSRTYTFTNLDEEFYNQFIAVL